MAQLTDLEFADWVPAVRAIEQVAKHLPSPLSAVRAIGPYLCSGLIRAAAGRHDWQGNSDPPGDLVEIEKEQWVMLDLPEEYDLWRSGTLSTDHEGHDVTYFDVRFDPTGLARLMAAVSPPSADLTPKPAVLTLHAGWDDLLIEMFRRIWSGELKPERQADLEEAMLAWAAENGADLNAASVNAPAKKLWTAYNATHLR